MLGVRRGTSDPNTPVDPPGDKPSRRTEQAARENHDDKPRRGRNAETQAVANQMRVATEHDSSEFRLGQISHYGPVSYG
jgi:hypothetical protein